MKDKANSREQGHWILAKMGKKVLRPGGKELTLKMIKNLNIDSNDEVVEFAPGLGHTAKLIWSKNPKSYTGIELNENAAKNIRKEIADENRKIIIANATDTGLPDNFYTKVFGEAMLTMQVDKRKSVIIGEAHRILKVGGLYGIHELGLYPDNMSEDLKEEIQRALIKAIKVNARPLTLAEWKDLLAEKGFKIIKTETNPMLLLEKKRMIEDEGLFRTLKILFNIVTHPKDRKRILAMRKVFRKYKDNLIAISIVAEKV